MDAEKPGRWKKFTGKQLDAEKEIGRSYRIISLILKKS